MLARSCHSVHPVSLFDLRAPFPVLGLGLYVAQFPNPALKIRQDAVHIDINLLNSRTIITFTRKNLQPFGKMG